jgi:catechol 2,3-dioxygenase-like lactoylglutathione lyase family enzyme
MKISHLNIAVPDVAATRSFFETFFDLRCIEAKGDNVLAVLTDEDGVFFLTLSNFKKNVTPVYPDDFHMGFIRNSVQQVNNL